MAKILLIISALVIAATAYLGFATKQKVETMQGELTDKKKALVVAKDDASKARAAEKKTADELIGAKSDLEKKEKDLATAKGENDKLSSDLKKTTDELTAKNEEIAKLTKSDESGKTVDLDKLRIELEELRKTKSEMEVKVAELQQVQETLKDRKSVV